MTSPILNLPNEVLNKTFGYVRTPATVIPRYTGDGQFSEIIKGLPSVCRRFRAVFNELSFWYDEDFDLLDLIRYREWYDPIEVHDNCQAFLKILLSDRDLVHSLERRSSWRFSNLISFQSVMEFVPSFPRNTTAVVLESDFICDEPATPSTAIHNAGVVDRSERLSLRGLTFGEETDFRHLSRPTVPTKSPTSIQIVFANLASCHRLTSLQISGFREPLDLDLIVRFCPLLRASP